MATRSSPTALTLTYHSYGLSTGLRLFPVRKWNAFTRRFGVSPKDFFREKQIPVKSHLQRVGLVILTGIIVLHMHRWTLRHGDPPLRLEGRPVSSVPQNVKDLPQLYFGRRLRFVFFNSWYGQFNNQIVSLINALFIARNIEGVLVLPCEKLGKESVRDSRHIKMRRLFSTRELVGDYFNYTTLLSGADVVRFSDFMASTDGRELAQRKHIVVERKSGGFYRFLFEGRPRGREPEGPGVRVLSPNSTRPVIDGVCDFRASRAVTHAQKRYRRDRFVFLPVVFRRHDINCSAADPYWVEVRRYLIPRSEFLRAVRAFMNTLRRPIFAIHLRVFLNGDIGQFTVDSYVAMLYKLFAAEMSTSRTLFIAYTPSSQESLKVVKELRKSFQGEVVSGQRIANFLDAEDNHVMLYPLTNVLMDMWVCVKSDSFLGRLGSSLSWNVVYWRQALAKEYGLDEDKVRSPLWYSLSNFTTTQAVRNEGNAW